LKKISCISVILSFIAITGWSQGFFIRTGLGYAIPHAGQTIDGSGTPYNGSLNNSTYLQNYNVKPASFSAGLQGMAGIGYMFSENAGMQLDASVGLLTTKYTFSIDNITINSIPSKVSVVQQSFKPIIFTPSLVLQTGGKKIDLYTRVGVALPLNTRIVQDIIVTNAPGTGATTERDFTMQLKSSFSLGFAAAAGIHYKLNRVMSIWGEFSFLSLSVYIKESELIGFSENGQQYSLSAISGPQTITYSKTAAVDTNETTLPTYSQPFSNVGFNLGISFTFPPHSKSQGTKKEAVKRRRRF
jgi:hypothetical protein